MYPEQFGQGVPSRSSRIACPEELAEHLIPFQLSGTGPRKGGPVLLRQGNTVYTDGSDLHSLIVGDTGSMKTLRYVLPMIRACGLAGESMVVVDPKGDLYARMSNYLKKRGYRVPCLNFRDPAKSPDCWNPYQPAIDAYRNHTPEDCYQQLDDLHQHLFFERKAIDPYWNESAGTFSDGIEKTIIHEEGIKNLSLERLLWWRYAGFNHLAYLYDNMNTSDPAYGSLTGTLGLTADKTRSCILSTFDQLIRIFRSNPALTKMLSGKSLDLSKVGTEKTAVFLIVPDEKTTYHFLACLFITQLYAQLLKTTAEHNGSLPVRVHFVLEEFCNFPKLTDLVPMLTAARSRNIRLHLVIQSYGQLCEKYDERSAQAVLDNCGIMIYLHSREATFLNYISTLTGTNEKGEPLISSNQLMHLKRNETLIFYDRCYPIVVKDVPLIFEYPDMMKCI